MAFEFNKSKYLIYLLFILIWILMASKDEIMKLTLE